MAEFDHCKINSGLDDISISEDIEKQAALDGSSFSDAAQKVYDRKLAEKAARKRAAYTNLKARIDTVNRVKSVYGDNVGLGMIAELVGITNARKGARNSLSSAQQALKGKYDGGFFNDMIATGYYKEFTSGALDGDVADAMWRMDFGQKLDDLPKEAIEIGKVIQKWNEIRRQDSNRAGAWIGKVQGYIAHQSHDMFHLRDAAKRLGKGRSSSEDVNFKAWQEFITPLLDKSTFDGVEDIGKFMRSAWEAMASGVHLKYVDTSLSDVSTPPRGTSSLARRLSEDRVFKFKDGKSWHEYNKIFGKGNLRESVEAGLRQSAYSTAIMRRFGANPAQTFQNIMSDLEYSAQKGGVAGRDKFNKQRAKIENYINVLDGSANIPANYAVARYSSNLRALKSMSSLGGSLLASIPDMQNIATEMHYQGHGILSGYKAAFEGLSGTSEEKKAIARSLGIVSKSLVHEFTDRFSAQDNIGGLATRGLAAFFKWNGQNWWTDSLRHGMSLSMSNFMANDVGKALSDLSDDMQRIFLLYDIDDGMWDAIRKVDLEKADGDNFFTPEMARKISDADAAAYLQSKGQDVNEASIFEFKETVEDKFRQYFLDRVEYGILEPDAKVRALSAYGGAPGTFWGEMARFAMQFKSFAVSMAYRPLARNLYGHSANDNTFIQALRQTLAGGNGEWHGLAYTIVMSTALGYMSLAAKDFVKGRTPRDPADFQTWRAAFVQGGGAAIYGDFLFNEYGSSPQDVAMATIGPVPSEAAKIVDIFKTLISDKDEKEKALAKKSFKLIIDNTPYANHPVARGVLDYLLLDAVQESINPGYKRRAERSLKNRTGQEYIDFSDIIAY